jgi:hypothetical protein
VRKVEGRKIILKSRMGATKTNIKKNKKIKNQSPAEIRFDQRLEECAVHWNELFAERDCADCDFDLDVPETLPCDGRASEY